VSWPGWVINSMVYPHKWSAAGRAQDREISPFKNRRTTTVRVPRNQRN